MRLARKKAVKILEIVVSKFLIQLSQKTPSGRNIVFVISIISLTLAGAVPGISFSSLSLSC